MIIVCLFLFIANACYGMEPIAQNFHEPEAMEFSLSGYKNVSNANTQELLQLLAGYITGSIDCLEATCEQTFTSQRALLNHYKKKHVNKKSIHEDISRMYGPEKYHCLYCNEHYFKYELLLSHNKINHESETTPPETPEYPVCLIEPLTVPQWQVPIEVNQKNKNYKCDLCNKLFSTKAQLANHSNRMHGGAKSYACDYHRCNFSYTTKASLQVHQLRMHGEKKYKCLECNLKFSMKGDLNQHYLRSHK